MEEEKKYLNERDVELRLHQTVVRYKDKYYFCTATGDRGTKVYLRDLLDTNSPAEAYDANDKHLEARAPELGWCMHRGVPCFMIRLPHRRQKQGLDANSLYYTCPTLHNPKALNGFGNYSNFFDKSFVDMLHGNYTSLKAVDLNKELGNTNAFFLDKNFAIIRGKKETRLYYQTEFIGGFDEEKQIAHLKEEHDHSVFRTSLFNLGVTCA